MKAGTPASGSSAAQAPARPSRLPCRASGEAARLASRPSTSGRRVQSAASWRRTHGVVLVTRLLRQAQAPAEEQRLLPARAQSDCTRLAQGRPGSTNGVGGT